MSGYRPGALHPWPSPVRPPGAASPPGAPPFHRHTSPPPSVCPAWQAGSHSAVRGKPRGAPSPSLAPPYQGSSHAERLPLRVTHPSTHTEPSLPFRQISINTHRGHPLGPGDAAANIRHSHGPCEVYIQVDGDKDQKNQWVQVSCW